MECAGNGRIFLVPKPSGLLWETGGVGTAVWRGVPLRRVLKKCGLEVTESFDIRPGGGKIHSFADRTGGHVHLRGADYGKLSKYPAPLHYNRGPAADEGDGRRAARHAHERGAAAGLHTATRCGRSCPAGTGPRA